MIWTIFVHSFFGILFYLSFLNFQTPIIGIPPTSPSKGPTSGGTRITVLGTNLGIGSRHRVIISNVSECKIEEVKRNEIVCVTSSSDVVTSALVKVEVDNWKPSGVGGFSYVTDPTFVGIEPTVAFKS